MPSETSRVDIGNGWKIIAILGVVALGALIEPTAIVRGILALAAALVAIWPSSDEPSAGGRRTRMIVLLTVLAVTISISSTLPDFLSTTKVRVWNVYHYYLGAKYFAELGYTDLYEATLQADREGDDYWRDIRRIRDLDTYEKKSRDPRVQTYEPSTAFCAERWTEFRRDVEALSSQRAPRAWRGIFVDRGYNATPFWTVVGATLTRMAPADRPLALKLLCSLDLLLLGLTFWLVGRTFGARSAALVALLFVLSPVNLDRLLGGFLQYDWFAAVAIGVCLYRRGRPVGAAAAMSYAILTRIFPVFFVFAGMVPLARTAWQTRRLPRRPVRFVVALGVCGLLGLGLSLGNGRGLAGWQEFTDGISQHSEHHVFGERRLGLKHLLTQELGSLDLEPTIEQRRSTFERQRGVYFVSAIALGVVFVAGAWRQRSWSAQLLGLLPTYLLLVISRYYWSYLALLPLAGGRRGPPAIRARWLAGAQLLVFAAVYGFQSQRPGHYAEYIIFGMLLLVYLVFTLAVLSPIRRAR